MPPDDPRRPALPLKRSGLARLTWGRGPLYKAQQREGQTVFPAAIPARCMPTVGLRAGHGGPWSAVPPTAARNQAHAERQPTWWGVQRAGQAAASADGAAGQEFSGWAGGLEKPWRKAGSARPPWALRGAGPPRSWPRGRPWAEGQGDTFALARKELPNAATLSGRNNL